MSVCSSMAAWQRLALSQISFSSVSGNPGHVILPGAVVVCEGAATEGRLLTYCIVVFLGTYWVLVWKLDRSQDFRKGGGLHGRLVCMYKIMKTTLRFTVISHSALHALEHAGSTGHMLNINYTRTSAARHFYFNRIVLLWNSVQPAINLSKSSGINL